MKLPGFLSSELVRRGFQVLVSGKIFEAPGLLQLRMFVYRMFFDIGKGTLIGSNVMFIRPHGIKSGYLKIGRNVGINHDVEIDYVGGVEIEDEAWLSQYVVIDTHQHLIKTRQLKINQKIVPGPLKICRDAWIGAFGVILPNVRVIGQGAVVGAGAVVTKDIPDYAIAGGVPAKIIGERGKGE